MVPWNCFKVHFINLLKIVEYKIVFRSFMLESQPSQITYNVTLKNYKMHKFVC